MNRVAIFVTGAAILALQLIASRVLAPFFGVSLYIWSGILSVTLLCLAIGYYAGGGVTRRVGADALAAIFYLLPAISSVAVAIACVVYPRTFGPLARFDLLAGSFAAATILLAVPLVLLSALNPILVALERAGLTPRASNDAPLSGRADDSKTNDAGAGQVFFISTIGSVAGVAIAAFALIPHLGNRTSIGLIGFALGALAIVGILAATKAAGRAKALAGGIGVLGAALSLWIVLGPGAERAQGLVDSRGRTLTIVAGYPSFFGDIKVVDVADADRPYRILFNDGIFQNSIYPDGRSASLFNYLLEATARTLKPDAKRALVLGLGAGVVPMALAEAGVAVDVVELNPRMIEVARRHFNFRESPGITLIVADARTVAQRCASPYDLVFVDLFAGDGSPEHLVTREFLGDVRDCLVPDGVMSLNAFVDADHPAPFRSFFATCVAVFSACGLIEADSTGIVVGGRAPGSLAALHAPRIDPAAVPENLLPVLAASLRKPEIHAANSPFISGHPILTDDGNRYAVLAAGMQAAYRRWVLEQVPDALLLN